VKSSERGRGRGPRPPAGPDHRRLALAAEAARIIQEEGLADFRAAKAKAAERLGLGRNAPLPDNTEIEAALAERGRIFHADTQPALLAEFRQAARGLMECLDEFQPRLAGDVLRGTATPHSTVELHLYSDTVEAVGAALDALGVHHRPVTRRQRFRRDEVEMIPGYRFTLDNCDFALSVFPLRLRGQAPLSPVDGRPMRRASLRELTELLEKGTP
jgi:hypothetical protein